jgi:hypothetical protein
MERDTCGLLGASHVEQRRDDSFVRRNIQAYWRKSVLDAFRRVQACSAVRQEFDDLESRLLNETDLHQLHRNSINPQH